MSIQGKLKQGGMCPSKWSQVGKNTLEIVREVLSLPSFYGATMM